MAVDDAAVKDWFKTIDKDGSESLDNEEIRAALALGGLVFNASDVDSMIRQG